MTKRNWPCGEKFPSGRVCPGEMILIDGDESQTRLRCSKCNKVEIVHLSISKVNQILNNGGGGI